MRWFLRPADGLTIPQNFFKYRAAGVREYWIVDADKSRVMVYNFYQDDMNEYSFIEDIPAGIYTDLAVRMSNLEL